MNRIWIGIACVFAMTLGACNDGTAQHKEPKLVTAQGTFESLGAQEESIAQLAIEALAAELNVPQRTISVDTVRQVEWRDSSIGCPQPDRAYLQVITPGHRISLRIDGRLHFVHEANGRAFVCKKTKSVGGITEKRELVWGMQAMEARKDLAARLGVEESLVKIAFANGTTWTDTSLGCPEPGASYDPQHVEGYVLGLRYGSRDYTYHTDLDRVIACPAITED